MMSLPKESIKRKVEMISWSKEPIRRAGREDSILVENKIIEKILKRRLKLIVKEKNLLKEDQRKQDERKIVKRTY